MSSQLALEILSLSAGLSQFSNFQIVNLGQQNNLVAIAPEYVFSLHSFLDRWFPWAWCLTLVDLQGLFVSGLDLSNQNNGTGNANETENANQDENLNEEEQAQADEEAKKAEEEAAKAAEEAAAAGNETANANEGEGEAEGEGAGANETAIDEGAAANVTEGEDGEDANANEEDAAADEEDAAAGEEEGKESKGNAKDETPSSEGRKVKKSVVVQRSAGGKRVPGAGKMKVLG
ncbi:hypothetical protein IFR04_014096, partial [Cadophora malorum]